MHLSQKGCLRGDGVWALLISNLKIPCHLYLSRCPDLRGLAYRGDSEIAKGEVIGRNTTLST